MSLPSRFPDGFLWGAATSAYQIEGSPLADGAGSTSYLIKVAAEAVPGAVLAIGTEYHLVARLANQYAGQKHILPLLETTCSNMIKVTETKLRQQLEALPAQVPVTVDEQIATQARLALERMLDVCR